VAARRIDKRTSPPRWSREPFSRGGLFRSPGPNARLSFPRVFAPGIISDGREQYRVTFTADGDTAYFGAGDGFFPATRQAWIYRSIRVEGEWQSPTVAPFSGGYSDIDPFISPDGQRLYFSSIRPAEGTARDQADIWMVQRVDTGWSEPTRLAMSTEHDDLYPSVDRHGNLYFGSDLPHPAAVARWNIFVARRHGTAHAEPEILGPGVNDGISWAFNPAISPDGRRLIFTRLDTRDPAGTGFGELFVSYHTADGWTASRNLGPPVNTPQDEFHPSFSPDERTLYFVRRDPGAPGAVGDIYHIAAAALDAGLRP